MLEATTYYYDTNNKLVKEEGSSQDIIYLYDEVGGDLIGFIIKSGTTLSYYYYYKNALGIIDGIVSSSGSKVVSYYYDPYGNITSITGTYASTVGGAELGGAYGW